MNCNQVLTENLIERYLGGRLDEATRDAFELHYFDCEACLAMVQAAQVVTPVLKEMPAPPVPIRRQRQWLWLAAAAAVIAAIVLTWPRAATSPAAPALPPAPVEVAVLRLAEIQPAPYSPGLYRGSGGDTGFAQAMGHYQARRWAEAASALSRVEGAPAAALHFAGISSLLAGKTEAALAALDRVIALGGKSPYEEEARYYRAQALLVAGRIPEARTELERVIGARGDYEAQARSLLGRL